MSDVELSSDSEDLSVYDNKPEEKKENEKKEYDGVPVVSSDDEEPPKEEEKKEVLEDVQASNEETTSEGPDKKPERAEMNHRSKGLKSLSQKLKEKAFKKADLAGEDPTLINHRLERRALAERLEEDSEFRAQYIQEQEEERKKAAEEEDESMNFNNTSELIDQVNRLQSKRRGDSNQSSSDDETTPSASYVSSRSMVDDDDDVSQSSHTRTFKSKVKNRGAPSKAGIYIHIENLTLNL